MIPDDVREAFRGFAPAEERLEIVCPAGDGWVYLSSRAIYAGRPLVRVPRGEVSSVEIAERMLLVLSEREERARAKFTEPQRAAMLGLSDRLSPARKRIGIELAKGVPIPGGRVEGRVLLEWPKRRHVRGIHVHLIGEEESDGKTRRFLTGSKRLFGGPPVDPSKALEELTEPIAWPELGRGNHAYPFRFRLPVDAPPSVPAVRYRLQAHVDLPFAFDLVKEEIVAVEPRPVDLAAAVRHTEDLTLHLEVEPFRFSEGRLVGTVRAENRTRSPIPSVELRLNVNQRTQQKRTVALARPGARAHEVTFHLALPRHQVPYRARWSSCRMALEARLPQTDVSVTVPLGP